MPSNKKRDKPYRSVWKPYKHEEERDPIIYEWENVLLFIFFAALVILLLFFKYVYP
jgi:hypothetical protein